MLINLSALDALMDEVQLVIVQATKEKKEAEKALGEAKDVLKNLRATKALLSGEKAHKAPASYFKVREEALKVMQESGGEWGVDGLINALIRSNSNHCPILNVLSERRLYALTLGSLTGLSFPTSILDGSGRSIYIVR